MTFQKDNENFIKFGVWVGMKGLTEHEKLLKYSTTFKIESHKRIKTGYLKVSNDVEAKIEFYKEVLSVFGTYDLEYILLCIYFDKDADKLIDCLVDLVRPLLSKEKLIWGSISSLFTEDIAFHNSSLTKGFLKSYFERTIKLEAGEWESEGISNNPVVNKLKDYIACYLIDEENGYGELTEVLLNFSKLWDIYYGRPFNTIKGIILVHKMSEQYNKINPAKLKVNFQKVVLNVNSLLTELTPIIAQSPLTDIDNDCFITSQGENPLSESVRNYLSKNVQFQKRLDDDSILFTDLSNITWTKLIEDWYLSSGNAEAAFINEIDKRRNSGLVPLAIETFGLIDFLNKQSISDIKKREFLQRVVFQNYIYYF
jgi:hypothetical protein